MGGRCILSISPCWPPHTYPHRVVKGPHFLNLNPPGARNYKPEPGCIFTKWWIGKKVPSFTFSTKRMSNKTTRCDVLVKQMFRTWMKTLLHCGFTNQCIQHDQKVSESRKKIYFLFVRHHCRNITRSEDKCIFYPYFQVKSVRFEL